MKNIEDINKASVKKILEKKKIPEFFAGDKIKVVVRILKEFVLQKKTVISTHHLQCAKFLLEKVWKEHLLYIVLL